VHKRHKHHLQQIRHILHNNNIKLAKADKGKTLVIIRNDALQHKLQQFLTDINMIPLSPRSDRHLPKKLLKAFTQCPLLIHKSQQKHIVQMKPNAPQLNVLIKIHKQYAPIRPVVNNRPAPAYKLAKFLTNKLTHLFQLPYTYAIRNTSEVAHDLSSLPVSNNHRIATFDIKDVYVKLSTHDIKLATRYWLSKQHTHPTVIQQTVTLMDTVLNQNYDQ
jgi:hypothetical protein